jgi:hypothetical protein
VTTLDCYIRLLSDEKKFIVVCCPLLHAIVSHCYGSRTLLSFHVSLGTTVAPPPHPYAVSLTLTFSIPLYKHKKRKSLISVSLQTPLLVHKVLTPMQRLNIRYACDYTVLRPQKGYFAINHRTELFHFPLKPFQSCHVESQIHTSI